MMPDPGIDNPILEEALKLYDAHGWFVIPTDPGAKKPYYGFTYKDRYGDNLAPREDVAAWPEWDASGVRLGTRTGAVSGIVVLDVDSQEAHEYIKKQGHPIGPMVQSPRAGGGLHLYFKHPGFYVKSTVAVGGVEGLDIRGDYGIVVLPPSLDHKSGRAYQWIIPPEDVEIPDCPQWLVKVLRKQTDFKEALDVPRIMAGIPEGKRDAELNRLAGKFRQMNMPEDVAVPMIELAAERCSPPFGKAEARAKVKWAYTHYSPGEDLAPILRLDERKQNEENGKAILSTFTLEELLGKEFPPVKWIVPDLLPEGTMLLTGKPKMGKSWLALGLCVAVATGDKALGTFSVEIGDVLYLALEDNQRRLQERARDVLQENPGAQDRLHFSTAAPRLDQELLPGLEEWLKEHPDARLVVIDTLARVRAKTSEKRSLYEQDYEVGAELTTLAGTYNVAIVLVHHLKKGDESDPMDLISGSTGLTGGMDGAMVLTRTRSAADAVLKAVHRDLKDDPEMALAWNSGVGERWTYIGDAEEYKMSRERKEIFDVLARHDEPMRPSDVADDVVKDPKSVARTMQRMRDEGYLDTPKYGFYVIDKKVEAPPTLSTHGGASRSSRTGVANPNGKGEVRNYDRYDSPLPADWRDHPWDCDCEECR